MSSSYYEICILGRTIFYKTRQDTDVGGGIFQRCLLVPKFKEAKNMVHRTRVITMGGFLARNETLHKSCNLWKRSDGPTKTFKKAQCNTHWPLGVMAFFCNFCEIPCNWYTCWLWEQASRQQTSGVEIYFSANNI